MTFIPHERADLYLQTPNASHFLFLIFGVNQGLVVERSKILISSKSAKTMNCDDITNMAGDAIASDPLSVIDEVNSFDLFDNRPKSIRITLGSKSIIPALEVLIRNPPLNRIILIQAGDLRPDSMLRRWFETQRAAISIECRPDEASDLQELIIKEISAACATLDREAYEFLIGHLGEDRLLNRSEVEKILLYTKGMKSITLEHVSDILPDFTMVDTNTLVDEAFAGNVLAVLQQLSKSSVRSLDRSRLFLVTLHYALSLHRGRAELEAGIPIDAALRSFLSQTNRGAPRATAMTRLQNCTSAQIGRLIAILFHLTHETRENNFLDDELASQLMITMNSHFYNRLLKNSFA
jgi:DNA polymerase-3 subunit delta